MLPSPPFRGTISTTIYSKLLSSHNEALLHPLRNRILGSFFLTPGICRHNFAPPNSYREKFIPPENLRRSNGCHSCNPRIPQPMIKTSIHQRQGEVPSLKLTVRTRKLMVGRRSFPFGMGQCSMRRCGELLVSRSVWMMIISKKSPTVGPTKERT